MIVRETDKCGLSPPFRAQSDGVTGTQGVALGWYESPRWG